MARLLLVDDDRFAGTVLSDLLMSLGHEVDLVTDASQALARSAAGGHEAIITDLRMPGGDGIELARRVGLLGRPLDIVLVSADPELQVLEEAQRRGLKLAAFLQKPFTAASVGTALGFLGRRDSLPPVRVRDSGIRLDLDDRAGWLDGRRGAISSLGPAHIWFVAARARPIRQRATTSPSSVKRGSSRVSTKATYTAP